MMKLTDDIRHQIALARYKLISPVLAEPTRKQNTYFRHVATQEHDMPHHGRRRYGLATYKSWLRHYREKGFDGLWPVARADKGRPRRVTAAMLEAIRIKFRAFPHMTVTKLHEHMAVENLLGDPPIPYSTLLRTVNVEKLRPDLGRTDARKRFEAEQVNDLWICDFMHGPQVGTGKKKSKAILCAIIDDHSRMIVGGVFQTFETISALTLVLKDALLTFGIPKRLYVDNGSAFSCDLLVEACARATISLVHSKPYDSPSRGKIERFFRSVRDRFLSVQPSEQTLEELNQAFRLWLTDEYHQRVHSGIDARPLDRYHVSAGEAAIKRLSQAELDDIFLVRYERVVNNDATISFKSTIYEVPAAYIRQRIEIRHPVDDPTDIALYDSGIRVVALKPVDAVENSRIFTPQQTTDRLSFAKGRVMP